MKQVVLIICDGLGYRKEKKYNAVAHAKTPNLNYLFKNYPNILLKASEEAIGLPRGQIGTSEANHLIIGSGRIVYQNLLKINHAIKNNLFPKNKAFLDAISHVKKHSSTLHIKGLVSPGGVHSHTDHLKALIKLAKDHGLKKVMIHAFTDGRDTLPKSAINYIRDLEYFISSLGIGKIVSVGGRYWAMDRDSNHDRIEKHFQMMVYGKGPKYKNALETITINYQKGITDEFIEPSLIQSEGKQPLSLIKPNDAVIFINFRSDRAKQITKRFINEKIDNLKFVGMTKYSDDFNIKVAFPPEKIANTLSEILSKSQIKQLKVTETEKFTHLTFFFNAQKYQAEIGEDRVMIESNKDIKTHDLKPEMKVYEIADNVVKAIELKSHQFICTNLVNCDIVGHTGNFPAIVKAVEHVDYAVGKILKIAKKNKVDVIITADHGNAEETFDEKKKQPLTSHTLNPVPFFLVSDKYKKINKKIALLSDIAPTILKLFNLPIPREMTGESLI